MTKQCPNCDKVFEQQIDGAFKCVVCGWFRFVDGVWHNCPEPAKFTEPEFNVPAPPEPVLETESDKSEIAKYPHEDRLDSNRRSYLGGLVTVTETEGEDEEND